MFSPLEYTIYQLEYKIKRWPMQRAVSTFYYLCSLLSCSLPAVSTKLYSLKREEILANDT